MDPLHPINRTLLLIIVVVTLAFTGTGCSSGKDSLEPEGKQYTTVTVENGDLKVIFVDNNSFGDSHKAGYNGIAALYHGKQGASPFVSSISGFNLEHIFAGDSLHEIFEPRKHPMKLVRKGKDEVLLYQSPTPKSGLESLTSFKVVAPHYIDITFRCVIHNDAFIKHNYLGLFWASYIHAPDDKKIYFKGFGGNVTEAGWIAAHSPRHGEKSTHIARNDYEEAFYFSHDFNVSLANHFSDYRYELPFYFGRFKNMVLAYLFDSSEVIRFSQSPTGGGRSNPAWDFQYIIPRPETQKEYSFRARIIYKPFNGRDDVLEEYQNWKKNL
jgi:hypothetical protein